MINLLVISGSTAEATQFIMIAQKLLKRNITIHIATSRKHVCDFIKEQDWKHVLFMRITKPEPSNTKDTKEYLLKYHNPTIAEMIGSEQILRNWSVNKKFHLLAEYLDIYESYFDSNHIDIVMKFPTCSFTGRAAFAVAKRRKLPTLIVNTGPVVSETFTLNDIDEGWLWSEFFDLYNNTGLILTADKRRAVDEIIDKVITEKSRSLSIKKPGIKSLIKQIILYTYNCLRNEHDYAERNELLKYASFIMGRIIPPARYANVDVSSPYIFFPLHIPWDAQIASRNPMFYSQEAVVEMLARSCPPGVTLYIKEHPYYSGGVNRKMLRKLKQFETVKVLDPSISSIDIIRNANVVVTINSTAGWEAILLKKPLIVLGSPYYAFYRHAYKVENINLLPKIVNEAFIRGDAIYENIDEWYRFLYSAAFSTHHGSMVFYKSYMGLGKDLGDQRISVLADELEKKIRSMVKDREPQPC